MTEDDKHVHLGPNQRRILELLKKGAMTNTELASAVYGKPVKVGSIEYVAVNRSLHNLFQRGLLNKTTFEIQWSLKNQNIHPKRRQKQK